MSLNDFWNRVVGYPPGEGGPDRITGYLFRGIVFDLAIGFGGISVSEAESVMNLADPSDALTEWQDFASSMQTITNASATTQRLIRLAVLDGIAAAVFIGEQRSRNQGIYETGELVRRRARDLVSAAGGTPQGTLAAADQ